jgi:hypothetical protein
MSINTDNIKAGDRVQIANGDWVEVQEHQEMFHIVYNNEFTWLCDLKHAGLLTAHLTAEEVEANGLPVSDREIVDYVSRHTHINWNGSIKRVEASLRPYSPVVHADGTDFRQAITHAIQQQRKDNI